MKCLDESLPMYVTCEISCEAFCILLFLLGFSSIAGASIHHQSGFSKAKFSEKC